MLGGDECEEKENKTIALVSHRKSTMCIAETIYSVEQGRPRCIGRRFTAFTSVPVFNAGSILLCQKLRKTEPLVYQHEAI